jgi:glycosyltransferase involved in cell wall biosynthesis
MRTLYQINMQRRFGGGEVYTRFLSLAAAAAGWTVELFVHADADFWGRLALPGVGIHVTHSLAEVLTRLPERNAVVLSHQPLSPAEAEVWAKRHVLTGVVHMPLYDRDPAGLARYRRLFAVSRHVLDSLKSRSLANAWPEPLLGVADLERGAGGGKESIRRTSEYDWDGRKLRDRALSLLTPLAGRLRAPRAFAPRPGTTLGIVSRLTPIKQWPRLFHHLAPVLARHPRFNLEIFGSGGYASVRDLRRALAPLAGRVRFWGQQADLRAVYGALDYVLSGLPEKEALGLNLIEAQTCGTPVLAVYAPPFTETVLDGATGFLYRDPRTDNAAAFEQLLAHIEAGTARPDPRAAKAHLEKFSMPAFQARLASALDGLA